MDSKRTVISVKVLEDIIEGKARVRRDFKLRYGRYSLKDLGRVLRRRGLTVGRKGEGQAEK